MAVGLMAVSSVIMSFGGLLVRNIEAADTWQINFCRACALVLAVLGLQIVLHRGRAVERIRASGRAGLLAGAFLAVAGIAFVRAITSTTVANTMLIMGAIPFITALLAWVLLGESLRQRTLVTMAVAAVGLAIMVSEGVGSGTAYGNLMALVTALGFSCFAITVRRNRHVDMLPALIVSGGLIATVSLAMRFDDLSITANDLMICVLWGGVMSWVANWMFIVASRHLVAAELTLFMLLEFALAPLWVWIFVNETPTGRTLAGGVLILLAVGVKSLLDLGARRGTP